MGGSVGVFDGNVAGFVGAFTEKTRACRRTRCCQQAPGSGAVPWKFPDAERILAFGDVHGDLDATVSLLTYGGLIGRSREWTGGDSVLVQVGDVFDRGTKELEILDLLWSLRDQARAQGGDVHLLLGNHELLNISGDFTYVSEAGFRSFQQRNLQGGDPFTPEFKEALEKMPEFMRARAIAVRPGGAMAKKLAANNLVTMVGPNVFVHAGLTVRHLQMAGSIENLNARVRNWLLGIDPEPSWIVRARNSPVWMRDYSTLCTPVATSLACMELERTLEALDGKRMIVGHTPQEQNGTNGGCGGLVWRCDTGMGRSPTSQPEILEICNDRVRVLTALGPLRASVRSRN